MKDFVRQLRSSRLQRGMSRFAVLCTALAVLTAVILTMSFKALSTTAHALPVSHGSVLSKGCGCQSMEEAAKSSHLTGSWTPPVTDYKPTEVARMPDAILLPAGETLPLQVSQTSPIFAPPLRSAPGADSTFHPGGTWSAVYGQITADGRYTAPRYVPARGVDTINYSFPQHPEWPGLQLDVRVVANPAIPGSGSTPYTVTATNTAADSQAKGIITWQPALPAGVSPPVSVADLEKGPIAVVSPGQELPAPVEVANTFPVPSQTKVGIAAYVLPATNGIGSATAALVVMRPVSASPLLQAKELPQLAGNPNNNPDPVTQAETQPCKEGTKESGPFVTGPITKTMAPNQPSPLASVELSAELSATVLKDFGIKIGAKGTVNVVGTYYNWHQTGSKAVYMCVNGQMTYQYTAQCFRDGSSLITVPNWVAHEIYNEPMDGTPNNWSGWTCNPSTP